MTLPSLHYDVLLAVIPFLDTSTLVSYAIVCRSLTYPTLRMLWKNPVINQPNQLLCFIQQLYHSEQLADSNTNNDRPYHEWSSSLTIAFDSFQPIPQIHLFQTLLYYHLPQLMELTLVHTFAVFSPSIRHYNARFCLLEIPISDFPSSSQPLPPLLLNRSDTNVYPPLSPSDNDNNSNNILWQDLYFGVASSFPLTQLHITDGFCATLTDDHLCKIALCCPLLEKVQLNGLFTDIGIICLAEHCHSLQELGIFLPNSLIQANTITDAAMECLAVSCPLLSRLTCLGQTRINPILAESKFRLHCPFFTRCDFRGL